MYSVPSPKHVPSTNAIVLACTWSTSSDGGGRELITTITTKIYELQQYEIDENKKFLMAKNVDQLLQIYRYQLFWCNNYLCIQQYYIANEATNLFMGWKIEENS